MASRIIISKLKMQNLVPGNIHRTSSVGTESLLRLHPNDLQVRISTTVPEFGATTSPLQGFPRANTAFTSLLGLARYRSLQEGGIFRRGQGEICNKEPEPSARERHDAREIAKTKKFRNCTTELPCELINYLKTEAESTGAIWMTGFAPSKRFSVSRWIPTWDSRRISRLAAPF